MAIMDLKDEIRITDLETLKVISDPLRVQILEHIGLASDSGGLTTVKQLSEALDIPSTKLYYHINLLEKHNLIWVAETRVVSGILEKHYQVRARKIRADIDISQNTNIDRDQGMALALSSIATMLDTAYKNVEKSFHQRLEETQNGNHESVAMLTSQAMLQLSSEEAEDLIAKVNELVSEFAEINNPDGLAFGLTILFNPNYHIAIPASQGQSIRSRNFQDEFNKIENFNAHIPPQL